jgi:hypothetical protein
MAAARKAATPAPQQQPRPAQRATPPAGGSSQRWTRARKDEDPFDAAVADDAPTVEIVAPMESGAMAAISKSEVESQLAAAHRWPRDIDRFVEQATRLATYNKAIAASCIYTLFRKEKDPRTGAMVDKPITGPSVRLAEIVASTYRNLHIATRIIEEGRSTVTAQAVCWDLENNLRESKEVARGIMTSRGDRYGADMIRVTSMAAMSIAMRNVVFAVVPGAFVQDIYGEARAMAVGTEDDLPERRQKLIEWCARRNIALARVLARIEITDIEQLTPEHIEVLTGIMTAIKEREITAEDAFPNPAAAQQSGDKPPVSKGSALDAIAAELKAKQRKSDPPPANDDGVLTVAQVLEALVDADESWSRLPTARAMAAVKAWSPEDQRRAHTWATTFVQTAEDQNPPEQPEFSFAPREPGEEG